MARETIVIKGVEKQAFRKLKSRAAKEGLTMGQAASEAFVGWSAEQSIAARRIRDPERMRVAAQAMDEIRSKQTSRKDWSSERVIREWRDRRH